MNVRAKERITKLSIVIPCFNEERTLRKCVKNLQAIADESLRLEIIIVDDGSTDQSFSISKELQKKSPNIFVLRHHINTGKGAALRTGFSKATGDFVVIQDADLEYNPLELKKLLVPLIHGDADVVLGSRLLSAGTHQMLSFWHCLGNRFLTFLSNMLNNLNLTDMETCYKVFRREVIQAITITENRFGFEPEIVAKIAHMRLRIFEMGISYQGRTYDEGKKIGVRDGIRAIYCILRYNAFQAPLAIQFLLYLFIGAAAVFVNLFIFLGMFFGGWGIVVSAPVAFIFAALLNYLLSILVLFRPNVRWNVLTEFFILLLVTTLIGIIDFETTKVFLEGGISPGMSKLGAFALGLTLTFAAFRFILFPEQGSGPQKDQEHLSTLL